MASAADAGRKRYGILVARPLTSAHARTLHPGEKIKCGAALTTELRKLAQEIHTVDDAGAPITKEQALAALIWKQALGWVEEVRDDKGAVKRTLHPPVAWAQSMLFERIEGKAQVTQEQTGARISAKETVSELAKQRLNALARGAKPSPKEEVPRA